MKINTVIGSMQGKKLVGVKLGLCALVGSLSEHDSMSISSFSNNYRQISEGFVKVESLRQQLPSLLESIHTDSTTAVFDAAIKGIKDLRDEFIQLNRSDQSRKFVTIVLTDGEDNESRNTSAHVLQHLIRPGLSNFMFLFVAVDMHVNQERLFTEWMNLLHCKQISVNVRSGNRLVGVFKEMLLCRMLQTEVTHNRFLADGGQGLDSVNPFPINAVDDSIDMLRSQLMRSLPITNHGASQGISQGIRIGDDDDGMDVDGGGVWPGTMVLGRCISAGISRVCSDSDGEDENDMFLDDAICYAPTLQRCFTDENDMLLDDALCFAPTLQRCFTPPPQAEEGVITSEPP